MAVQANQEPEPNVWYVDTGCSNHMCGSKSSFSYLNEGFHFIVSLTLFHCEGDGKRVILR